LLREFGHESRREFPRLFLPFGVAAVQQYEFLRCLVLPFFGLGTKRGFKLLNCLWVNRWLA
jgi:hypothetical protein